MPYRNGSRCGRPPSRREGPEPGRPGTDHRAPPRVLRQRAPHPIAGQSPNYRGEFGYPDRVAPSPCRRTSATNTAHRATLSRRPGSRRRNGQMPANPCRDRGSICPDRRGRNRTKGEVSRRSSSLAKSWRHVVHLSGFVQIDLWTNDPLTTSWVAAVLPFRPPPPRGTTPRPSAARPRRPWPSRSASMPEADAATGVGALAGSPRTTATAGGGGRRRGGNPRCFPRALVWPHGMDGAVHRRPNLPVTPNHRAQTASLPPRG